MLAPHPYERCRLDAVCLDHRTRARRSDRPANHQSKHHRHRARRWPESGRSRTGECHRPQQNTATGLNHGIRGQGARLANHAPGQLIDGTGRQQNLAGVHPNRMAVFDQGIDERGLNLYPAPLTIQINLYALARSHRNPTIRRHDQAFVDHHNNATKPPRVVSISPCAVIDPDPAPEWKRRSPAIKSVLSISSVDAASPRHQPGNSAQTARHWDSPRTLGPAQ